MIGYLIVVDDTHADPDYKFRWGKEAAIKVAEDALVESCGYYSSLEPADIERYPCDGKYGFWFSAQSPCGSFKISVREVDVPERKEHGMGRRV